jgi:hypothetical protein
MLKACCHYAGCGAQQHFVKIKSYGQPVAVFLQLHGGARNHASTAVACTSFAGGDDGAGTCCR